MNGVPIDYIEAVNADADIPDLAVVLTADPTVAADRIHRRGTRHRFETGPTSSRTETDLYRDTVDRLTRRGHPVLTLDTTHATPHQAATMIARRITAQATARGHHSTDA